MIKDEFLNELMEHIIEGVKIPKVQVERAINPILSLFIEGILSTLFKSDKNYSGSYKLVSPEYPLKKDENNQSTNIDFLLVNNSKNTLVFFELKTDVSSIDMEQVERYFNYKIIISECSAKILKDNLNKIISGTNKRLKYDFIVKHFDSAIQSPENIKKVIIIYLVPKAIQKSLKNTKKIDYVLAYSDLPQIIDHKYADYWSIVRKKLLFLDYFYETKTINSSSSNPIKKIVKNIKNYLYITNNRKQPLSVRLGILGDGNRPNYQIKFTDGSIETFYFSGKPHNVKVFKENNLGEEYFWNQIMDEA